MTMPKPEFIKLAYRKEIGGTYKYWGVYKCYCGNEVIANKSNVNNGNTRTCGCYRRTCIIYSTHNMRHNPAYNVWMAIKQRCYNPNVAGYKYWGGKGIRMAKRWVSSFPNFLSDMGPRPSKLHSIDRVDSAGHYVKSNCVWATATSQARHRSNTVMVTYEGVCKPLSKWCEELELPYVRIYGRIHYQKWSVEDAFNKPINL